jgi:signal peptidase I
MNQPEDENGGVNASSDQSQTPPYAGFWIRVAARLTDMVFFLPVWAIASWTAALATVPGAPGTIVLPAYLLLLLTAWMAYLACLTARHGQTVGKWAAGLKVVRSDLTPVGWRASWLRAACDVALANLVVGLVDGLAIVFSRRKRALHDAAADTLVIRTRRPRYAILAVGLTLLFLELSIARSASFQRCLLMRAYYIPSGAMRSTLQEKDRVLCNALWYRIRAVERGDIVIFRAPPAVSAEAKDFIKRVIGLPGDTLAVRDGKLFRNGEWVEEPYIRQPMYYQFPEEFYTALDQEKWGDRTTVKGIECVRVPKGMLFVLGDNRNDSNDSHRWGYLPLANLRGRAVVLFLPLQRYKAL